MASNGHENSPDRLYYSIMTDASIETDHLLNSLTETTAGSELVTEAESELIGYSISSTPEDKENEKKELPCVLMLCAGVHPYDCKSAGAYTESPKLSARNHSFTYKEIVNNSLLPNTRKQAALRNLNDDEYGLHVQNQVQQHSKNSNSTRPHETDGLPVQNLVVQQHSKNSDCTRPHKNHAKETYAILDILDDEDEETEDDSTIGSDDQIPQTIVTAYSSFSIQNGNEDAINSDVNSSKRYKSPYHDENTDEDSSKSFLPPVPNIQGEKPLPSESSTNFTIIEDEQYQSPSSTSTSITHNEDKILLNSPQSNPVISKKESTEIPPPKSSNNMLAMEDEEVETNMSSNNQLVLFNEPEEDTHNTQSIEEQLSTGDGVKHEESTTNTADQYKKSNPTEMCTEEESKKVAPSSSLVLREEELEAHPDVITFKKKESLLVPEISKNISPVLMSTGPEARRETFTGVFNGICSQKISDTLKYMMKMAESTPNKCYDNEKYKQISLQSVLQRTTCPLAIPTGKMASMCAPDIVRNESRSVVETIEIELQSPKSQHTFKQLSSLEKTPDDKKWGSVNIITIRSSTEIDGSKNAQEKQASNATTEIEVATPAGLKDLKDGDASVGSKKSSTSFISALSIGSQQWNKLTKPKQQQGVPLHHSLSCSIATSKGKSRKFSSYASTSDKSSLGGVPISTRSLPTKPSTITKSAHTSSLFTITSGTRAETCSTSSTLLTASSGSDAAVQLDTDSYTRSSRRTTQEEIQPSYDQDGLLLTNDNNNEVGASNDTVPTGTASRRSTKVPIVILKRGIKPRRSSSDSSTTSTSVTGGGVPKLKRTTVKTTSSGSTVKSTGSDLNQLKMTHQKRFVKKNSQEEGGDGASSAQPRRHKFVMNLGMKVRELQQLEEEVEGNKNIKSMNMFKRRDKRRRWNASTTGVRRRRIRTEDAVVLSNDLVLSTTEETEDVPNPIPITAGSF